MKFESYVTIFSDIGIYDDILSDELVYSNRVNNILFQCSVPNEVFMIEVYNKNLNDENLEGYSYLNISETNFNNISVLMLHDAKKNEEE